MHVFELKVIPGVGTWILALLVPRDWPRGGRRMVVIDNFDTEDEANGALQIVLNDLLHQTVTS